MARAVAGLALWRACFVRAPTSHPDLRASDWRRNQHNDSDSRSPGESLHSRSYRASIHQDDFDLCRLRLGVGGHLAVRMEARRRKVRPVLLLKNLFRFLCFCSSQSLRTPVSQAALAKFSLRSFSTASSDRCKTQSMNFSRKLTSAGV
jgi:hypothetical protein